VVLVGEDISGRNHCPIFSACALHSLRNKKIHCSPTKPGGPNPVSRSVSSHLSLHTQLSWNHCRSLQRFPSRNFCKLEGRVIFSLV